MLNLLILLVDITTNHNHDLITELKQSEFCSFSHSRRLTLDMSCWGSFKVEHTPL